MPDPMVGSVSSGTVTLAPSRLDHVRSDQAPLFRLAIPPMDDLDSISGRGTPASVYSTTQIHHLMRVEFGRAQRYDFPLSLAVVAIDGLDDLRARWGFDAVGEAVEEVTATLRANARGCDHLGQLVDRRLAAVLPHTLRPGAEAFAGRLLSRAADLKLARDGESIPLSVSIGLSTFEAGNTMFFDAMMEAAEAALEQAREAGGGRVAFLGPGELA